MSCKLNESGGLQQNAGENLSSIDHTNLDWAGTKSGYSSGTVSAIYCTLGSAYCMLWGYRFVYARLSDQVKRT